MKNIFLILISIFGLYSCSDSETEQNKGILTGNFTEITPVNERVTLEFSSETQLTQRISEYNIVPTFTIRLLSDNQLELSCNECDELQPTIVSYRIINNRMFEIGGFFPAESTELMTFKRK